MTLKRSDDFLSDFLSDDLSGVEEPLQVKNPFEKLEKRMGVIEGSTKMPPKKEIKLLKDDIKDAITETRSLILSDEESFEDKNFIQEKLKVVIIKLESQLDNLENSLLIGAEPRLYETYYGMAKTLVDSLGKLMDLQKQVQTSIVNGQMTGPVVGQTTLTMEQKVTRKVTASNFDELLDDLGD